MQRQQSVLCCSRQSLQIFLVKTPAESYRWNWISSGLTAVSLRGPNDTPALFRIDKNNLISSEKHTGIMRGGIRSIIGAAAELFPPLLPSKVRQSQGWGDSSDSPMVLSRFTFQVKGPSWSIFLFVRSRFCHQGKEKKLKFPWMQVMIKHRNARGIPVWS